LDAAPAQSSENGFGAIFRIAVAAFAQLSFDLSAIAEHALIRP
jgi:hypothetical protein